MRIFEVLLSPIDRAELLVSGWMERHGYTLLRVALGVVFIWFAALKPLGLSPAAELIDKTMGWFPLPGFIYLLTAWELAIGVCFLYKPLLRWGVVLLLLHMPGTMLPLITLPEVAFLKAPYALTLEGQYIIKNLVLIAAALVLGGKIRHRMRGAVARAPDAFHSLLRHGHWGVAEPGEVLAREGERMKRVYFIRDGGGVVRVGDREVGVLVPHQFVGEMSFLTDGKASATVEVTEPTAYVAWDVDELRALLDDRTTLDGALRSTMNLDLIGKLKGLNQGSLATSSSG